ncbi:hypothetical protein Y032_0122g1105 [Ancylostoma ceylanicum]|uniref:Uncharacterized protein n=1 Tax=Ancylostoma ceylanicum TaxID=53326 RepID=A0A016TA84_9BILA|nr:hypothetical protein Y032_0122g1105 [Ancylostoma ceylanicum]
MQCLRTYSEFQTYTSAGTTARFSSVSLPSRPAASVQQTNRVPASRPGPRLRPFGVHCISQCSSGYHRRYSI